MLAQSQKFADFKEDNYYERIKNTSVYFYEKKVHKLKYFDCSLKV